MIEVGKMARTTVSVKWLEGDTIDGVLKRAEITLGEDESVTMDGEEITDFSTEVFDGAVIVIAPNHDHGRVVTAVL